MPSNLIIPVFLRRTLGVVQATEQGVLAELLLDFQGCFLQPALLGSRIVLLLLFLGFHLIVSEEVELHGRVLPLSLGLVLADDVVDGDVEPPDQQDGVDDAVVELRDSIDKLTR